MHRRFNAFDFMLHAIVPDPAATSELLAELKDHNTPDTTKKKLYVSNELPRPLPGPNN